MRHPTYMQCVQKSLACALVALLAFPASALAQQAPAVSVTTIPATGQALRILPLAGSNGFNDLERQIMSPLAVQVLDQNDVPVDGATVVFRFPINGPSAVFPGQQSSQTVRTSANGQARAAGWVANNQTGSFVVQVTALRGPDQGMGTITMTNVARILGETERPKKRWWTSKWAKIAYVGAAAAIAGGIVAANRGSNDATIRGSVGIPTIGGPQ